MTVGDVIFLPAIYFSGLGDLLSGLDAARPCFHVYEVLALRRDRVLVLDLLTLEKRVLPREGLAPA